MSHLIARWQLRHPADLKAAVADHLQQQTGLSHSGTGYSTRFGTSLVFSSNGTTVFYPGGGLTYNLILHCYGRCAELIRQQDGPVTVHHFEYADPAFPENLQQLISDYQQAANRTA